MEVGQWGGEEFTPLDVYLTTGGACPPFLIVDVCNIDIAGMVQWGGTRKIIVRT